MIFKCLRKYIGILICTQYFYWIKVFITERTDNAISIININDLDIIILNLNKIHVIKVVFIVCFY